MIAKDIIDEVEKFWPCELAQGWDNTGLLIGDKKAKIKDVLLTIDVTADVVAEAKALGCKFILSYHPVIWDGLKKIVAEDGTKEGLVYDLVKSGISVYSIHTALDVVDGGVNDGLADMVGIANPMPIGDFVSMPGDKYKLAVFVPVENVNQVADAVFEAGAGAIGNYSNCSFKSQGQGSFKPMAGAKPSVGSKGKLEKVEEIKFETIVSGDKIEAVVAAMRLSHRYEEPAFDVIKLSDIENKFGLGRMGELEKPTKVVEIVKSIKKATGCKVIGIVGDDKKVVEKAAVCAGTCGKILNQVIAGGCDLYLTGELKHHEALVAQEAGLTAICLSHTVSERFMLKKLAKKLKKSLKDVKIQVSKKDKDPFVWKMV